MTNILYIWIIGLGPSLAFFIWLFRDIPGDPYLDNNDNGRTLWILSTVLSFFWPITFAIMVGMTIDRWGNKG